jgi:hypothetical protein
MYQKLIISYLCEAQHVSGDTAHHQEPKTALAASGFACVESCWPYGLWTFSTSAPGGHLLRETIPDAALIQFDS